MSFGANELNAGPLSTLMAGGVADANNFSTANGSFASLAAGSGAQGAFKLRKALEKTLDNEAKKLEAKGKKGFRLTDANLKAATSKITNAIGPQGMEMARNFGSGNLLPSTPLPSRYKKIIEEKFPEEKSRPTTPSNSNRNPAGDGYDFLASNGSNVKVLGGGDSSNNTDYEYGKNDINTNSSESIWNIITHRYHQSGLERLFE